MPPNNLLPASMKLIYYQYQAYGHTNPENGLITPYKQHVFIMVARAMLNAWIERTFRNQ